MPTFTISAVAADIHDGEFNRPPKIGSFQYQIPPCKQYSNVTNIVKDIESGLNPQCLSFVFSNLSLQKYTVSGKLENHFSTLRSNLERIDLDFTQLTNDVNKVVPKVIKAINHIQKICNYKLFISLTVCVNASLQIPDIHIEILKLLLDQYINIGMINILVTKTLKMRNVSWPVLIQTVFHNVQAQLHPIFLSTKGFPGKLGKYFGLVLDCDILLDSMSMVKSTVRQMFIHGDRKNIHEFELLDIWAWIQKYGGGQMTLKSYPSNSKNINEFMLNNQTILENSKPLPLPEDMLDILLLEDNELPHYNSTIELERTPTYRTIG